MIGDAKAKIAAGLIFGVPTLLGSAQLCAADAGEAHYRCNGNKELAIRRNHSVVEVRVDDRTYRLSRKALSIGEHYSSDDATLIIDGSSAVFIAGDHLRLSKCLQVSSAARAG